MITGLSIYTLAHESAIPLSGEILLTQFSYAFAIIMVYFWGVNNVTEHRK